MRADTENQPTYQNTTPILPCHGNVAVQLWVLLKSYSMDKASLSKYSTFWWQTDCRMLPRQVSAKSVQMHNYLFSLWRPLSLWVYFTQSCLVLKTLAKFAGWAILSSKLFQSALICRVSKCTMSAPKHRYSMLSSPQASTCSRLFYWDWELSVKMIIIITVNEGWRAQANHVVEPSGRMSKIG